MFKGHNTISALKALEQSQWHSREQLSRLQSEKIQDILNYACARIAYYKGLFESKGIKPCDIKSAADLKMFPFLTKEIIRENTNILKADNGANLTKSNTGGSTGGPLTFYLGKDRISADVAAKIRATRWWDVDIGDREAVIWGSPVELTKQDRIRQLRDMIFLTKLLSAFNMTEKTMSEYLDFLRAFKPLHIFGYPSSIYLLCSYARRKNIRLDNIGVKVVFCTAERLYDYQRELISEIFNAPVANGYGGRDSGFIAHECPEGRMHITDENIIVEIIDPEGNPLPANNAGEIVVTHLMSHDFPFIRYKTGDVGVLSDEQCPCGRGLTVLKSIEGRSTDFIITPDGKIMHGLSLIYVMRELEGIDEFKIIQEEPDLFTVNIVRNPLFNDRSEEVIINGFRKITGSDIKINFLYPLKIEAEKSGKFRYVVSKVQTPYTKN
ncbi:MAG: phenylacetate--CoA ligase family protein [Nitrospirae bacterium]|nr:phenylacetate--CoA ligase family protein [Nitrospirota bacterium]